MKFQDLPTILPLYAAGGTILLPRAQLPIVLHKREDKALLEHALSEEHRLIGVIQANPHGGHFQKGCVGRITHFQDGPQIYLTLGGLCRFTIEEIITEKSFNKARVCYQGYEKDMETTISDPFVNRPQLLNTLKDYLDEQEILANWDEIDHASDDLILNSLSMACPFKPIEKQALLEMSSLSERCDMMIALMEMASPSPYMDGSSVTFH